MRSGIVGPIVTIVRYIDLRPQEETFPAAPLAVRWPSTLDVRFQAFCGEASMSEMKARSCHRAGAERTSAYARAAAESGPDAIHQIGFAPPYA